MMGPWRSRCLPRAGATLAREGIRTGSLGQVCVRLTSTSAGQFRRPMSSLPGLKSLLRVSDEVAHAIATNKPVVALESTIYTHGGLGELHLEEIVRDNGGVPAICGIYKGVPTVGLTWDREIQEMIREGAQKVSRRDFAMLVGMALGGGPKLHGGTTIAGTMILARLAGIRVFGTGGLGGVHRGGESSMDISADLTELGKTRVAVISSGCKGFLDIPRTLEYLETQGAVVSTFRHNRPDPIDFPAFWAQSSGVRSPSVVQDPRQAAAAIYAQEQLGLEAGLLFANPVPTEYAIPSDQMAGIIERAVREAAEEGHTGSRNTPAVLKKITEYTDGLATKVNIKLVQDNVRMATLVAVELSKLLEKSHTGQRPVRAGRKAQNKATVQPNVPGDPSIAAQSMTTSNLVPCQSSEAHVKDPRASKKREYESEVAVAGSVAIDLSCDFKGTNSKDQAELPQLLTSNPATMTQSIGGVGHNVAVAAYRASGLDLRTEEHKTRVELFTYVGGDDSAADTIRTKLGDYKGLKKSVVPRKGCSTARYVSINDSKKNLMLAMADMDIYDSVSDQPPRVVFKWPSTRKYLVVDANWSSAGISSLLEQGCNLGATRIFEPVSIAKSQRLFPATKPLNVFPHADVEIATPNVHELKTMWETARSQEYFARDDWFAFIDQLDIGGGGATDRFARVTSIAITNEGIPQQCMQLLPFISTLVVTMGDQGVLLAEVLKPDDPRLKNPEHAKYVVARNKTENPAFGGIYMRLYPSVDKVENVVSVNGAGDTFLGVLVAGLAMNVPLHEAINTAQRGAIMTLRSKESVSPELREIYWALKRDADQPSAQIIERAQEDQTSMKEQALVEADHEPSTQAQVVPQPSLDTSTTTKPVSHVQFPPTADEQWGVASGVAPIVRRPETQQSGSEHKNIPVEPPSNNDKLSTGAEERWGDANKVAPVFKGERRFHDRKPVVRREESQQVEKEEEAWGSFSGGKKAVRP